MAQFMNREIRRRMHGDEGEEEEDTFNSDWDSANVAYAIIVSIGAGLATGLGGALVFFPSFFKKIPQNKVLGVSLALSAGVMLYVSFIEIFAKSLDAISNVADITEGGAAAITTTCFFFGMLICVGLEILVHWLSSRYGVDHSHTCPAHGLPGQGGHTHGNKGANGCDDDNCARETLTPPPSPPPSPAAEGGEGWRDKRVDVGAADASSVAVDVRTDAAEGDIDAAERKRLATMGAMTALAIAIHNFPEGLATFLATVADTSVGLSLGVAIAVHNIPEGICVAMPIYYATGNKWKAFGWSLLSGVTEPIGGILGFAALQPVFTDLVFGMIFSMVGGMMVFIVLHELLPAAHRYMNNPSKTTAWLIMGMVIMSLSLVLFVQ
jgi:ZIP family zinc transporter